MPEHPCPVAAPEPVDDSDLWAHLLDVHGTAVPRGEVLPVALDDYPALRALHERALAGLDYPALRARYEAALALVDEYERRYAVREVTGLWLSLRLAAGWCATSMPPARSRPTRPPSCATTSTILPPACMPGTRATMSTA